MKQTEQPEQEAVVTRSDILNETEEERKEREEKEIASGKRAPAPEGVDQSNVAVTQEAAAAYADAAPKAVRPQEPEKAEKNDKKSSHAHHGKK